MILLLASALLQAAPIAPPLPQGVADCVHPTYATDQLVCSDPALRAADRELAGLLAALPAGRMAGHWIEDQQAWFARSRRCAFQENHTACVDAAYRERIGVLRAQTARIRATATCRLADGSRSGLAMIGDVTVLSDETGVVAVAGTPTATWTPFISYARAGRVTTLRDLGGATVATCTDAGGKEDSHAP